MSRQKTSDVSRPDAALTHAMGDIGETLEWLTSIDACGRQAQLLGIPDISFVMADAADDIVAKIAAIQTATAKAVQATIANRSMVEDVLRSSGRIRDATDHQSSSVNAITATVDETALAADMMSGTVASISKDTEMLAEQITSLSAGFSNADKRISELNKRGQQFVDKLVDQN